jgi:copine 1/2/3
MNPVTHSNDYVRALRAVGDIISCYMPKGNLVAAYGFGADISSSGTPSHCFPLSLQSDPHCVGVEGVYAAYDQTLGRVSFAGPTNFAPVIETTMASSKQREVSQRAQNYDVLLILTDGVVSDFDRTVDRIIDASMTAPLSIIIIGVGSADWDKMKKLDSDDKLISSADGSRQAKRDIVQFVPFNEFASQPPDRLAAHVLSELPGNVVEYMTTLSPPVVPNPQPLPPVTY